MSSSNLPNKLRDIPVFIGNPWVRVIDLLEDVVIVEPVTAEVWFAKVVQPSIVVTPIVDGHTITVELTTEQIALLPSKNASLNIKFGDNYVFQQKLTPTYEGAIPDDVIEEYETPGLGVFRVSYFTDITNAKEARDAAILATQEKQVAEQHALDAYGYMIAAQIASVGSLDAAGTFNAATGVASQAQSATNSAATFTPTVSSTKQKGYTLDINVAGTTNITGTTIPVAIGGKLRSNGVGFPWTYVPPTDTGYAFVSQSFIRKNLAVRSLFIEGRLMQSNGSPVVSPTWSHTGQISVVAGQVISMNTDENIGFTWGCFYNSLGGAIAGTGWDGGVHKTETVPDGAVGFIGTFHTAFIDSVMVCLSPAPLPFVPDDEYQSQGIKTLASDIITDVDRQFVDASQKTGLADAINFIANFNRPNIANPASFLGRYMQKSGVPVTNAAWKQTGSIPVTPGQFLAMNTNADTGWQYGCFFTPAFAPMPSFGWDLVNTKNVQVPAGAGIFIGSFLAVNAGSAMLQVVPTLSTPPDGYVGYNKLYSDDVFYPPANLAFDKERQTVTSAEKSSLSLISDLTDPYTRYELKGWIPKPSFTKGADYADRKAIFDIILDPITDFEPFLENGSIDTGGTVSQQYCSATPNSHLYPENCREWNMWAQWVDFIWKKYYPGQRHARFDTPSFFNIAGSVTTTAVDDDIHWGHQFPDPAVPGSTTGGLNAQKFWDRFYQLITPNSGTDVASVSFFFPANFCKAAWIFSGSHMAGLITLSVDSGNNIFQKFDKATGAWVELNGSTFDTATPDEFKNYAYLNSVKMRKDQPSMALKIRRKPGTSLTTTPRITATMAAGKRIEHWGLYYTSQSNLFIPRNHAKGSHNLNQLQAFHEFGLNKIEPNVYILGCPTINEMVQIFGGTSSDPPTTYANRFVNFLNDNIVGLSYIKGVFCRIRGFSAAQGVFGPTNDQSLIFGTTGSVSGWTYINYKNQLVKSINDYKATRPAGTLSIVDHTDGILEAIEKISRDKGITKRLAHYPGTQSADNEAATYDSTHDGNFASRVYANLDKQYWIA